MTTKVELKAQSRSEVDGKSKNIIATGFISAVIYGFGKANQNIKVKKNDFEKVFSVAGEFNLVSLTINEAEPIKVIIKAIQRDSITDNIIHVDFYQVDMNKKITTEIPLNFVGETKVVKELGGTLVKNMDTVEVESLPGDLVSHIDVDISVLAEFDQFIRLHDLVLPKGIVLAQETNEAVIGAVETKIEEEAPKVEEAVAVEGQTEVPAGEESGAEVKAEPEKK